MDRKRRWIVVSGMAACLTLACDLQAKTENAGKEKIQSAGPICFGPAGVLFVGDPQGAAIFAFNAPTPSTRPAATFRCENVEAKVASLLGTTPANIAINDMAVQPETGIVYLSVSRGKGPDAAPVIVSIEGSNPPSEFPLENASYTRVSLNNAPSPNGSGRAANARRESITDMAFLDGRLVVAGLSNEEFASKLRAINFPFSEADSGTSVEVYHGAHGQLETRSPVRTFVPLDVGGRPHLIAAYTCTPLVKFPLDELKPGRKVKGTTIAELGNRNRPLDMIVYEKDGGTFLLLANSARGVMKIPTEKFESQPSIETRINGTAGIPYETIGHLKGVEQLAKWDAKSALILARSDEKTLHLETVPLP